MNTNFHRSTSRVIDILEIISNNPNTFTLTDISNKLDVPKSSISPILRTLVMRRFLKINTDGVYSIDFVAYQVGCSYLKDMHFWDEVDKIMENVTNACLETTHFATLINGDVFYIKKIDSPESIRLLSTVGAKMPAYGTALGKSLMIDYELEDLEKIYPEKLVALTPNTITNLNTLIKEIHQARTDGYTQEIEESNQYVRCLSVPIRQKKKVVAAMSVAIPVFRFSKDKETLIIKLLTEAKTKIECILDNMDMDFHSLV